jgi:hypothetical protein
MEFDVNELTIGQAKELASIFPTSNASAVSPMVGKTCVIRTYSAGVHVGEVARHNGREVLLKNARRIWRWGGAFTLSEVATKGVDPEKSRIAVALPEILLTEAVEIIPATKEAMAKIEACHE